MKFNEGKVAPSDIRAPKAKNNFFKLLRWLQTAIRLALGFVVIGALLEDEAFLQVAPGVRITKPSAGHQAPVGWIAIIKLLHLDILTFRSLTCSAVAGKHVGKAKLEC